MSLLDSQLALHEKALQLLDVAGYVSIEQLAQADPTDLRDHLLLVNQEHKIFKKLPSPRLIEDWIDQAQAHLRGETSADWTQVDTEEEAPIVNFEYDPEVLEMISMAPLALPLPGHLLAQKKVPVSEIPEAVLLTSARGDVSIRVGTHSPEKPKNKEVKVIKTPISTAGYVNTISFGTKREEVDPSRFRSTEEFISPEHKTERIDYKAQAEERMRVLRAALPETNRGVNPESRRYVRGVLHTHPITLWWGAVFTLMCHFLIPSGIFAAIALLAKDQGSSLFLWVPNWFLFIPVSVFVVGLLYLTVSYACSCRICGQKCFVPRNCLKNRKAHHIPLLGHIFAVALHMILFRWFRCTYCGTPVRLKQ
jgi:hypothetical protein